MDNASIKEVTNIDSLLQRNDYFADQFLQNPLMQLIISDKMNDRQHRYRLLSAVQAFANNFHKVLLAHQADSEKPIFITIEQANISEEYARHLQKMRSRTHQALAWDPILESGSAWFLWKILSLSHVEKNLLLHLVLEAGASIFLQAVQRIMQAYDETNYSSALGDDETTSYEDNVSLLCQISHESYQNMIDIQEQGWRILNMVCEQMASMVEEQDIS